MALEMQFPGQLQRKLHTGTTFYSQTLWIQSFPLVGECASFFNDHKALKKGFPFLLFYIQNKTLKCVIHKD